MKHKREYHIPENAEPYDATGTDAAVYTYTMKSGILCALAFVGRAQKPKWKLSFRDETQRAGYISRFLTDRKRTLEANAKWKAEKKADADAPHTFSIGDILSCSWGYDQTNVNFYQVLALSGTQTVTFQELKQETSIDDGAFSGTCLPLANQFLKGSEPLTRRVAFGAVKIESYSRATLWNGKPRYWSSYA